MRPVTFAHWEKMSHASKSWLVSKAFNLGDKVRVYWHITKDGSHEGIVGGSYSSRDLAVRVLKANKKDLPANASIRTDISFPMYSQYLQPGWDVVRALTSANFTVEFACDAKGVYCICRERETEAVFVGYGVTLSESVCVAALRFKGILPTR